MHSSAKFSLPFSFRDILKEPIGMLVSSKKELFNIVSKGTQLVSIGDQVTYTILSKNISPLFCVIDYQTKRKKNTKEINVILRSYGNSIKQVVNPPGVITYELWDIIENAYKELHKNLTLRIEVNGEEDLAALPAILLAPENVTIIYGLPDRGVVIVPSKEEHKQKVKEILTKM